LERGVRRRLYGMRCALLLDLCCKTGEIELITNRLKALRQKKERLGYAVERLNLQSQQKQRQLRMSIAATKD
jgi:hypothetical protein